MIANRHRAGPQITRSEWRWAIGWSIVILLLSCLPYLIAAQMAPAGWQFAGFLVNPYDGHSYLAKMRQGFEGNWLFHLTYTAEPHDGVFIFTFYLALGHLAALIGLPLIWLFHLVRLAGGFFLLVVAFRFVGFVTPQLNERRLAFVFILTASGFGWLGIILGAFPIDLWVPEAFVPYSLYTNPHFPLGQALMLIIFQLVVWPKPAKNQTQPTNQPPFGRNQSSPPLPHWPALILPSLTALALALILPFGLLTVWVVLLVFLAWLYLTRRRLPWPQIWPTLGVVLAPAPIIAYDTWISISQPIIAGWSAQNVTPAPALLDMMLGYGLVGLLAIGGAWLVVRTPSKPDANLGEWLVLWWAITGIVLVYLPLDLQRRLINGLHLPLCILAGLGLRRWLDRSSLKIEQRRLISTSVIAVGAFGTLIVWSFPLLGFLSPPDRSATTALFFLRQEEIVVLKWLHENGSAEDIVLASPRLGLFAPGQTGARSYYGHPFETIDAEQKRANVEAFYRGELEQLPAGVDWVIYGPSEQALGQPEGLSNLRIAFATDNISIYDTGPGTK